MGNVVALSSFELNRESKQENRCGEETAVVLLFTGVRYERIGERDEALGFKNKGARLSLELPASSKS